VNKQMPATFEWAESNGAAEMVTVPVANANFGNVDAPNLSTPNNRVVAGQNSYEKWLRGRFSGTYTAISNLKCWKSGGVLPANVSVKAAVNAPYSTPVSTPSAVATADVPTAEASALVPASPGASPSFSGYITMQLQIGAAASPGAIPTQTYTLKYDEV
jgi:hypothetical protein